MIAVERNLGLGEPTVSVWAGEDAEALLDLVGCECECEGCVVEPTMRLTRDEANALVVELLRGPAGAPGPMGPKGASA